MLLLPYIPTIYIKQTCDLWCSKNVIHLKIKSYNKPQNDNRIIIKIVKTSYIN